MSTLLRFALMRIQIIYKQMKITSYEEAVSNSRLIFCRAIYLKISLLWQINIIGYTLSISCHIWVLLERDIKQPQSAFPDWPSPQTSTQMWQIFDSIWPN